MNTCLEALRKKRTQETLELDEETAYPQETPGGDNDPEEAALSSERRNEIWAAHRHVRAEHGVALVLRHMEGLSYTEIAEALGIPVGTAKGWTSRGRTSMLVALTEKDNNRQPAPPVYWEAYVAAVGSRSSPGLPVTASILKRSLPNGSIS